MPSNEPQLRGARLWAARCCFAAGVALAVISIGTLHFDRVPVVASSAPVMEAPVREQGNPDHVCAGCHASIYERYERTSMARGSGPAMDGALTGEFRHARSGVSYRVFRKDDSLWMSYARASETSAGGALPALEGRRRLLYFIGSGHQGRTYLYEVDGQWFELPINFYGQRDVWEMAPNYESATSMPAPLPVDANCLHCHATGVQAAKAEAGNRFAGAPFSQGGIGCSSCHGDATEHLSKAGHGPIVNPDKLTPAKRDDVCLQCHLEGDAVVYRPGRSLAQFRPGDRLDEDAVYFVRASAESGGRRATSQYEALLRSACKAGSGDRLTCTTCHDPHGSPAAEDRVNYFRSRCLSCHTGEAIAQTHHPEQRDCAVCHMPNRSTSDISHEQVTDHNIQRIPRQAATPRLSGLGPAEELKPVGAVVVGDRELGLAYAQMAERGDREAGGRALALLARAEAAGASDAPLHTQLGYLSQVSGQRERAISEYTLALKVNAYEPSALGNLAVLEASGGRPESAISLLQRLLTADGAQIAAGLNLAFIECEVGEKKQALGVLHQIEAFSPDDPLLRIFLERGVYAGQRCELR